MVQYSETTTTLGALIQNNCAADDFQGDYWNIDDILSEEQCIPCTMLKDARGLAHLDQMNNSAVTETAQRAAKKRQARQVLPKDKTVDMPTWLGMALSKRDFLEMKKPPFLTQAFFNQLQAGAEVVTMATHSPYIYEITMKLVQLYPEESQREVMEMFQGAFVERFSKLILDYSTNANEHDQQSQVTRKLSNLERELFELHKRQKMRINAWQNKTVSQVQVNYDFVG